MSDIIERTITIENKKRFIRLERDLWMILTRIAQREKIPLNGLILLVYTLKGDADLSREIEIFCNSYLRELADKVETETVVSSN